ncbi:MAG TPA: ABC transporter substrate-binding protein [Anaerolineales bacterium]|nr:ABC transporter substrate-binding protein [Anaerolineales bacterium]
MKRLRWQLVVVVITLGVILILLLSQQPGVLPGIVEPVVQPTSGGAYSEALVGSLRRLNPMLDWYNQPDKDVDRLLYCSLMRFDERAAPLGEVVETYGISADGTVYNFSIRENAVWHDGEPVTSDDIVYTTGLLADPDLPAPEDLKAIWADIDVVPLDDKTFQMVLPEPFGPFLDFLAVQAQEQRLAQAGILQERQLGIVQIEQYQLQARQASGVQVQIDFFEALIQGLGP